MVRKHMMAFVQSIVGNGRRGYHTSIIATHPRGTIEGYAHHTKSISETNDLLRGLMTNHAFRSIGGRFYCLLLIAKENNRCLVDKMNNARPSSTSDKVMVEIGIRVVSSTPKLTSRYRFVRRKFLSDITIKRGAAVIVNRGSHTFMVRDFNSEKCSTIQIATKVAAHAFKLVDMALTRRTAISRHGSYN
jgi:hypothetical protein